VKQVEVTILGQGYVLACPDGGKVLLEEAVKRVDHEMSAIRDSGKVKARERIAVLAALNLAYQMAERGPASAEPEGSVDVAALVRRIDAALSDDGHLL